MLATEPKIGSLEGFRKGSYNPIYIVTIYTIVGFIIINSCRVVLDLLYIRINSEKKVDDQVHISENSDVSSFSKSLTSSVSV